MHVEMIKDFASQSRGLVVAAAGCGKTELIARAVATNKTSRQLVLTHTHAGVRALRDRLRLRGADPAGYNVDTIAGFSLRYAASFPVLSGCNVVEPCTHEDWLLVYGAAVRSLGYHHVQRVLRRSYGGLFVDEYQDCTEMQHQLIMALVELLPTRIVGDPLQGIFGFSEDDPLVDWTRNVYPVFNRLPDLKTPYRWRNKNEALGQWLTDARGLLISGDPIRVVPNGPVSWVPLGDARTRQAAQIKTCYEMLRHSGDSIVVIRKWAKQAHSTSKVLKGRYRSMEEVECKDLLDWCQRLEEANGMERSALLVQFALACMTKKPRALDELDKLLRKEQFPGSRKLAKHAPLKDALRTVMNSKTISSMSAALRIIVDMQDVKLHRRELYREMLKATRNYDDSSGLSLRSTAWKIRDGARRFGRFIDPRVVSRTTLVKGLEFDHVVIVNADDFDDAKNLYVALTRGTQSLTVMSVSRNIQRSAVGLAV